MSRKRRHDDDESVFVYHEHTELASIPRDITSLRIDKSVRIIPPEAFSGQERLTRVEYEEGLEVIGHKAFMFCSNLREQQFPSTLIEIGMRAFRNCTMLRSVGHLPPSLTTIRDNAFSGCLALEKFEFDITNDTLHLGKAVFSSCYNLSHVKLARGMLSIPNDLFYNCASLVDVNLPSSVLEIGERSFAGCEKLTLIELPTGLKTIGSKAFNGTQIKHFHLPATVESIESGALEHCSLESVTLPPKLEVIASETFQSSKLKDISIPPSVVRIGRYAFRSTRLKSISLPRIGLRRIEERTFEGCLVLTHLWVPPTVEYIDNGAFADCISLLSVEVPETLKRLLFVGQESGGYGELCGYRSLVNLYLPPSHRLDQVEDYDFMETMKLREAEGNYPALVDKLKCRFNNLPLHSACYFQSYSSLQENIKRFKMILRTEGTKACERVDFLGMTPFHILALSQRPWLNLFQELLAVSSTYMDVVLNSRDVFGATPLEYLCKNYHSPAAVSVTKSLLVHIVEQRMSFLGLASWRDDLISDLDKVLQIAPSKDEAAASVLGDCVTSLCNKLDKLERKEVLSLLEMSVWKMKIMEENVQRGGDANARESYRISCGSNFVLESVMPLLGGT